MLKDRAQQEDFVVMVMNLYVLQQGTSCSAD